LLDQRVLPAQERYLDCKTAAEVAEAIHSMSVRGAPAIGIAAAYGLVLDVRADPQAFDYADAVLAASRPTAINLRWALARMRGVWTYARDIVALEKEARRIHEGAAPAKPIYGEATPAEAEALAEDGIDVARIPWVPRADS